MSEKLNTLKIIFEMLKNEKPLFLIKMLNAFTVLFLLCCTIFVCILLLQISKNLFLKGGKNLLTQGICCVIMCMLLSFSLNPRPLNATQQGLIDSIVVSKYDNGILQYAQSANKADIMAVKNAFTNARASLYLYPLPSFKSNDDGIKLLISYEDASECIVIIKDNRTYLANEPDTGMVLKLTSGYDEIAKIFNRG